MVMSVMTSLVFDMDMFINDDSETAQLNRVVISVIASLSNFAMLHDLLTYAVLTVRDISC